MTDNHSVVVASGHLGAEFLAIILFKFLSGGYENVCAGVQAKKLACPLLRQMVGYYEHGLLTKAKVFAFHRCRDHLKRLSSPDLMREQGVSAIENVRHCIGLMLPHSDFWIHSCECDMGTVVLPQPDRIEPLVVGLYKRMAAVSVLPDPVTERILDGLLFLLCQSGFLLIQNPTFLTIRITHNIEDTHITQIQRILQNMIGIDARGAVRGISRYVGEWNFAFA